MSPQPGSKWPAVADAVRARIADGTMRPGELASVRGLAPEFGVGEPVVARALAALAREGLVAARPGTGYVVAPRGDR